MISGMMDRGSIWAISLEGGRRACGSVRQSVDAAPYTLVVADISILIRKSRCHEDITYCGPHTITMLRAAAVLGRYHTPTILHTRNFDLVMVIRL